MGQKGPFLVKGQRVTVMVWEMGKTGLFIGRKRSTKGGAGFNVQRVSTSN